MTDLPGPRTRPGPPAGRQASPSSAQPLPRLGIFGGTFDPPHVGHVAAALACRRSLGLDRVLLVVANHPWQKVPCRSLVPAERRFAMVVAAVEGVEGLEASRLEIDRGGASYTVETVEALRREAGDVGAAPAAGVAGGAAGGTGAAGAAAAVEASNLVDLWVLIGSDLAPTLPTWHRAGELQELVSLGVVVRPGATGPTVPAGWRWRQVPGPMLDVSSSEVRDRVARGQPIDDLVPPAVVRCIRRLGLYARDG